MKYKIFDIVKYDHEILVIKSIQIYGNAWTYKVFGKKCEFAGDTLFQGKAKLWDLIKHYYGKQKKYSRKTYSYDK